MIESTVLFGNRLNQVFLVEMAQGQQACRCVSWLCQHLGDNFAVVDQRGRAVEAVDQGRVGIDADQAVDGG